MDSIEQIKTSENKTSSGEDEAEPKDMQESERDKIQILEQDNQSFRLESDHNTDTEMEDSKKPSETVPLQ